MSAHTPGPWVWQTHDDYPKTDLIGAGDFVVLSIYQSHGGGELPAEPDQRLIAAAPKMLAALKAVLMECYDDGHSATGELDDVCQRRGQVIRCGICEALIDVRAAIAESEGSP